MDHPDWPAFAAAIVAHPDDDTARLVAADFLEEHDDPDRAAFIRIQVHLAHLEAAGQGKSLDADHLRAKERAFLGPLSMYRSLWAATECPELVRMGSRGGGRDPLEAMTVDGADRVTWRRGFIEDVRCPVADWQHHGAGIRLRLPVRHLTLGGCDTLTRDQWYTLIPVLRGLRVLAIQGATGPTARWLEEWLPGTQLEVVG